MPRRAQEQSPIHQRELLKDGQCPVAQGTVDHVPVAGTECGQNKLAQVLALAHLGIVLHAHMESVQLMPGNVGQQLREVQAPQELDGGIQVGTPVPREASSSRAIVQVAVSEHVARAQGLFVGLQVDGILEELPEVAGGPGPPKVGRGQDGVAGWGRLAGGATGRAGPTIALFLRILPVHGMPPWAPVMAQAFGGLGWRPALLGLLPSSLPRRPAGVLLHARLLLFLLLHALHLVPVGVFLEVALATTAGAEAECQVIALLGPHVLAALLLVPAAGPANAVELDQDAALPLVEALQVHPSAARALLVVAHHLLIVVLLQVHRPPKAADQGCGTGGLCGGRTQRGESELRTGDTAESKVSGSPES